jgi:hypothetical protein
MSLIFEALRKLEREKQAPERAVVVMGAHAWARPEQRRGLRVALQALAAVALMALGAGGTWLLMRPAPIASGGPNPSATLHPSVGSQPGPEAFRAAVTPAPVPRPSVRVPGPPRRVAGAAPAAMPSVAPDDTTDQASADALSPDPRLDLQAISERDGEPIAILGGRMVRVGDAFDEVRVLRIGVGEVEIELAGQRRVLRF